MGTWAHFHRPILAGCDKVNFPALPPGLRLRYRAAPGAVLNPWSS